jgi:hypothetical protein
MQAKSRGDDRDRDRRRDGYRDSREEVPVAPGVEE